MIHIWKDNSVISDNQREFTFKPYEGCFAFAEGNSYELSYGYITEGYWKTIPREVVPKEFILNLVLLGVPFPEGDS